MRMLKVDDVFIDNMKNCASDVIDKLKGRTLYEGDQVSIRFTWEGELFFTLYFPETDDQVITFWPGQDIND